ncbi:regulatory protein, luxR family [Geodermatophilus pulveris]|uniref:Regulatory protein, luxR family n=1 Tax=Geodermatophilus pulveris TaxID=1564159 RepID=A0A239GIA4_9ACTN|nr:LuxR C-terminal-related transcriptional regulator [Geodermatophilus pulveris]SNS69016.1 regulatory protein, luxR family [Geodermatophilus pulveris]
MTGTGQGTPVVGRADTIAAISGALEDAGVQLVAGPAGIGRTTVATAAADRTGREVWAGGGLPALADRPGLALARAVRVPVPAEPQDAATLVVALTRDGVLLLDDVQWADAHSVRVTVASAAAVRTLLCVTEEGHEAGGAGDAGTSAPVARAAARTTFRLAPLADANVAALVRRADPAAPEDDVARIVAAARGNPAAALALVAGDSRSARRALAVRARALSVAGRTALVVLGLRGRPTRAGRLGPGAAELVDHGLAMPAGPGDDPLLAFPSAATYALAGTLASAEALAALHRHLAAVSRDPWDRVRHLAGSGDPEGAVGLAIRAARELGAGERARLLAFAAGLARGERRRQLWQAAAEAADAASDGEAAAHARRQAVRGRLTDRESEVMTLVAAGMTTAAVARRLLVSAETVETHVRSAVAKLGGRNRTEAAVLFAAEGR